MFEIVIGVTWIFSLTTMALGFALLGFFESYYGVDEKRYELSKRKKADRQAKKDKTNL